MFSDCIFSSQIRRCYGFLSRDPGVTFLISVEGNGDLWNFLMIWLGLGLLYV